MAFQLGKARMKTANRGPLPQRTRRECTGDGRASVMAGIERIGHALAQLH